ncbi:11232_t:CDS:2 [Diversispora eburnea]|uniref:11232_t:CDS:1 n=1 Tax=Diversispora eburnea TaxID=1213867 RepID=A0A9N9F2M5_9GLOM|nr:11232_t:CDS:2 [Diversispora eburnea]
MDSFSPQIGNSADSFFQTDAELAIQERRATKQNNKAGDPITCTSKVLCMVLPNNNDYGYIGESGFIAKKINLSTGKSAKIYKGHNGPVTCIGLWYNGGEEYLITGSWDKTIRKFNTKNSESIHTFISHTDFVKSLIISHIHIILFSGSSDKTIKSWNLLTGESLKVFRGHTRGIEDLAFDEGENFLYSASSDNFVRKWNPLTAECLQIFKDHLTSIYCLKIIDEEMWTASADTTVKRWDLSTGKPDTTFKHPDFVKCISLFGPYVITGSRDEIIRVFDIGSEKLINAIEGHFDEIGCMCIKGTTLYTGSLDCTIRKWSLHDITKETKDKKTEIQKIKIEPVLTKEVTGILLTEEEEKELAELMESDE